MSGTFGRILRSAIPSTGPVRRRPRHSGARSAWPSRSSSGSLSTSLASGVFGAIGAVSVGFGSFPGRVPQPGGGDAVCRPGHGDFGLSSARSRGRRNLAAIGVAAAWGFGGGSFVALGPVGVLRGPPVDCGDRARRWLPGRLRGAAGRAALVFGGGLVQTFWSSSSGRCGASRRNGAASPPRSAAWPATPRDPGSGLDRSRAPHLRRRRPRRWTIHSRLQNPATSWCSRRCSTRGSGSAPAWRASRRSSAG